MVSGCRQPIHRLDLLILFEKPLFAKEKDLKAMKRLSILFLLWAVLPGGQSLATDIPLPNEWTAPEAVEFVLRNNPDSLVASQRMLEAQALLKKSAASFYPQLGLSGGYSQTNNPMHSFGNILNQGEFSSEIDFNDPGRSDNLNLSVGVKYRFYNGGQDSARKNAAVAGVELSSAERESIRLQLGFEAFRSFQRIVEAETVQRAQQVALDAIHSALAVARARFDAGDLLKVDLLNLEVQELRIRESQIQASHSLELSKQIFLTLLGLPAGEVKVVAASLANHLPPAINSPAQRPELRRMQAALRVAEAGLSGARGSRLPTLDGFASYQVDHGTVLDGEGDSWTAGIKVNFNLFDGHNAAADIALAEARLGTLRAELRKLELALNLEVKQAELALSQARQRKQVTQKMLEQASETEQLSRARFREGVLLASDLIDIESRLTDARVRNAVAISAVHIAIADLRRASGLPQFAANTDTNPSVENR
jgi:outer membrane protein TolC